MFFTTDNQIIQVITKASLNLKPIKIKKVDYKIEMERKYLNQLIATTTPSSL